jgi:hypothetical protein
MTGWEEESVIIVKTSYPVQQNVNFNGYLHPVLGFVGNVSKFSLSANEFKRPGSFFKIFK